MERVLRLDWSRCRDGYDLITFDPQRVDWPRYERDDDPKQPQLTSDEQRLLSKWGEYLRPSQPDEGEDRWFLEKSNRFEKPDIMAKEPRLFAKLAESAFDEKKQERFVNEYGPLSHKSPCSLSMMNYWANTMTTLIKRRESERRRKGVNWLRAAIEQFGTGFDSDIHIAPEVLNGDVVLVLRPEDLSIAMLVQFIFYGSRDFMINQCACCGSYIPKGPKQNRTDRKYCSNACRQREFRQRRTVNRSS